MRLHEYIVMFNLNDNKHVLESYRLCRRQERRRNLFLLTTGSSVQEALGGQKFSNYTWYISGTKNSDANRKSNAH